VPDTAQRALNDFCSPGSGRAQTNGAGADQPPQCRLRCGAAGPVLGLLVLALIGLGFCSFLASSTWTGTYYCADGAADDGPPPAEDGLTDLIQAITFQRSSGDLITVPMAGIGPTTFSLPLRL
jgi:hypothetical protein